MTYNEKNKQWWIFENPNDKSLSVVYHSNPKWIAERDTLYHVIEHTAYQQALEQIAKLGLALEKINIRVQHYKDKDVGHQCNSKVGCQSASDISREALAELKKWRGEG